MDALTKAISEVRHRIPPQILRLVFSKNGERFMQNPGALESAIRDRVIDSRVRVDVDLIGATQVEIPLADEFLQNPNGIQPSVESYNRFTYIYRVPKEVTQGRTITSALAYSYGFNSSVGLAPQSTPNQENIGGCGYGALLDAANAAALAMTPIVINQTARVSIIGDNVILVEDYIPLPRQSFLRCLVTHDTQLSTIKPGSYRNFSDLVVLATKAYIYNIYYIELGQGFLQGGQELGQLKEIVDGYSDAEQLYQEYLKEKWRKISFMNDPARMQRMAKMITGGKG